MTDLTPGSPEHMRVISASKVASIVGVSPWDSPRSLWLQMKGEYAKPQNTAMRRGHYLEPAIMAWWRDQHPEFTGYRDQPQYLLGDWALATPDAVADDPAFGAVLADGKSAARMDEWGPAGTDEVPDYYLIQFMWAMHVSNIHRMHVPVIGPFLEFSEYVVDYDAEIGAGLEATCREFYDSLKGDVPPALDGAEATFLATRDRYNAIREKTSVELSLADATEYIESGADKKTGETRERLAKSTVLDLMGDANFATYNGIKVARRQKSGKGFTIYPACKDASLLTETDNAA